MTNAPMAYEIQEDGPVCRIILPPRKLGELRRLAFTPLLFGCFTLLFMAMWIGMPLSWGFDLLQKGQWFGLLLVGFAMFGLAGVRMGLLMVAGSIAVWRDSTACTLEIRPKKLVSVEKFGLLKWRRKIRIKDITKLSVSGFTQSEDRRQLPKMFRGLAETESIIAHRADNKFPVAVAYPRETLVRLANELATRLERQQDGIEFTEPTTLFNPDAAGEIVSERPRIAVEVEDADTPSVPVQPVGSTIAKHEVDGSTVFQVPPAGIRKGSRGLMAFAILWTGFMTVWTLLLLLGGGFQNPQGDAFVPVIVFTIVFWAIGIALTTAAVNMGRRSTMIGVTGGALFIKTKSIFGEKNQSFLREDLKAIEHGPSGMEINDRPINELQIHPRTGKKTGLLSQRTDDELEWLAHELSLLLQLETPGNGNDWKSQVGGDGRVIPPASGAVTVSETITGKEITVPALGLTKGLGLGIFSILFVCIGGGLLLFSIVGNRWGPNPIGPGGLFANAPILLFAVAFSGMGTGTFVAWRVATTRRFDISVSQNQLVIERFGLLSRKTFDWPADTIQQVNRVRSDTSINNRALDELEIQIPDGSGLTLMTGRAQDEIDFVAAHINLTLQPGLETGQLPRDPDHS